MLVIKDKQLNFFNRHFKSLLFLTVVVILVGAYLLLFSPLIAKTRDLSQNVIKEKEDDLTQQKKLFNELSQLNNIYNQVSPTLKERVADLLPPDPTLPNLYYNLDQLAKEAGYIVLSVNTELPKVEASKAVPSLSESLGKNEGGLNGMEAKAVPLEKSVLTSSKKNLKEIKITLGLSGGGYLNFKSLLDLIEHNLRIIDAESFTYTPEEADIELNLKTYYYE